MKKYYLIPLVASLSTGSIIYFLYFHYSIFTTESLLAVYSSKLQSPLFSGFLTLSGFLLSLTTFIVVKMHESVYQDSYYLEKIEVYRRIDENYKHTGGLENLSRYLLISVVVALITAFTQFTVGNFPNAWVVLICLSLAVGSFVCVLVSCLLIKKNVNFWINHFAEKKKVENEKKKVENENKSAND